MTRGPGGEGRGGGQAVGSRQAKSIKRRIGLRGHHGRNAPPHLVDGRLEREGRPGAFAQISSAEGGGKSTNRPIRHLQAKRQSLQGSSVRKSQQ